MVTSVAPDALESVRREAEAAREASAALSDDAVARALGRIGPSLRRQRDELLAVNAEDVARATDRLDEGSLARLRLDPKRIDELAQQAAAVAGLPPLDRLIEEWTLDNGLRVAARRIPIGVV